MVSTAVVYECLRKHWRNQLGLVPWLSGREAGLAQAMPISYSLASIFGSFRRCASESGPR